MKSYILGDKVNTIKYGDRQYIKSRPVAYKMKNVLTLQKQRILVAYFYDLDNHKMEIKNTEQFEEVCRKLCITKGQALNYLRLKEILQDYETGSKKAKNTKKWKPNSIISVRAINTITGETTKSNTVRELAKLIGVSETSIRKAINNGIVVKITRS